MSNYRIVLDEGAVVAYTKKFKAENGVVILLNDKDEQVGLVLQHHVTGITEIGIGKRKKN